MVHLQTHGGGWCRPVVARSVPSASRPIRSVVASTAMLLPPPLQGRAIPPPAAVARAFVAHRGAIFLSAIDCVVRRESRRLAAPRPVRADRIRPVRSNYRARHLPAEKWVTDGKRHRWMIE